MQDGKDDGVPAMTPASSTASGGRPQGATSAGDSAVLRNAREMVRLFGQYMGDKGEATDDQIVDYTDLAREHCGRIAQGYIDLADINTTLLEALKALIAQHDRPHGFDDDRWYAASLATARAALTKAGA